MSDDFQQRGGSPWGSPPGGGGSGNGSGRGPRPPDVDKIIKEFQDKIKKFLPGGSSSGGKQAILVLIILGFVWLASGLYRVLPDEQGVVLRFGKFVKTTQPGLNYHIPFPVESVLTPKVTKVNRIDIGFRSERDSGFSSAAGGVADVPQESLMLTGDENIVNIDFSVFWVIKDAGKFLFKIQDPEGTVKAAAETAMREVIARSEIQPILTEGRSQIEIDMIRILPSNSIINGTTLSIPYSFYTDSGYFGEDYITLNVGTRDEGDPMGPDEHGYYIYDSGDVAYPLAPEYDWIEITGGAGGGQSLDLTDAGDGCSSTGGGWYGCTDLQGQDTEVIQLPFTFQFHP